MRADQQLGHVVAGDVLHDRATRLRRKAVACHVARADHDVARCAVAVTARAGGARGEDAAERGIWPAERIEHEALTVSFVGRNSRLYVVQRSAGTCHERHVAGLVVDDASQRRGRQDRVAARGAGAPVEFRAAATHRECQSIARGGRE